MWTLDKHTCKILHNSIMLSDFDLMPLDHILNVSLSGFRKRVANRHKNLTVARISEMSIELDS
jgi:hypothetical protein